MTPFPPGHPLRRHRPEAAQRHLEARIGARPHARPDFASVRSKGQTLRRVLRWTVFVVLTIACVLILVDWANAARTLTPTP